MEVLYAIISILFISSVIVLLVLLFRNKTPGSITETDRKKLGTKVSQVFGGKNTVVPSNKHSSEYHLEHGSPETLNETIRDTALDVIITNERDPEVRETCSIQDDDALSRDGIIIGREDCDYNMKSLLIDRDGTFLIKRIGNNFVLIARRKELSLKTEEQHAMSDLFVLTFLFPVVKRPC